MTTPATTTDANGSAPVDVQRMVRLIVCAAVRNKRTGQIVTGARHFDYLMRCQMTAYGDKMGWQTGTQGFVDQRGDFLTREEAWKVADAAGQIRRRCGGDTANGGRLFSENLY